MRNLIKAGVLIITISLSLTAPVAADQVQDMATGSAALSKRDYAAALRLLHPLAERGNAGAQWMVGRIYEQGCEVSQADATADAILKESGVPIPATSSCVPQDYAEAVKWYRKSAEQGNATGQWNIGNTYYFGYGVKRDYAEAMKWYRLAAEQGDMGAQDSLGEMYKTGKGVPKNDAEAAKWMHKSDDQMNANAEYARGLQYYNGGDYKKGASHDYEEAMRRFRKAADYGNVEALSMIGIMYEKGNGVQQNYGEAVKWYRKAADRGDTTTQSILGMMYESGKVVPQDYVQAHMWYNLIVAHAEGIERDMAVKDRDRLAAKMTPEQIAQAQRLSREWKPK